MQIEIPSLLRIQMSCDIAFKSSLVHETNSAHFNKGENIIYSPRGSSTIFTPKKRENEGKKSKT